MDDFKYDFRFSETTSINLYIIRILSAELITITHGVQGIGFLKLGDYIGSSALMFFFLISGMLVSYSTFRKIRDESYDFKKYFLRRFSRIYPNLILVLFLIILIDSLWFIFLGGKDLFNACNPMTFISTLFFINDSVIGYTSFCSARQLWALPPIWWLYMLFGWLILGRRTVRKKYLYILPIIFFSFMILFVMFGYHTWNKFQFSIMWFLGGFFAYSMNKADNFVQEKSMMVREDLKENSKNLLKRKIKIVCITTAFIFLILAIIRLYFHADPLDTIYYYLWIGIVFCVIIYSQYTKRKYPKKVKKVIIFMADYSLTLYLLHFSIFNLLMEFLMQYLNRILVFFILFIFVNIVSLGVAYFTEMKSDKVYYYLLEKFNLKD
jgi:peptidoglycan/LPS O-acetylase OafA/YrhL